MPAACRFPRARLIAIALIPIAITINLSPTEGVAGTWSVNERGKQVYMRACEDPDFQGGRDRVTYRIDVGDHRGPFRVEGDLWYQPIAFRWAMNLMPFEADETQGFVRWYRAMSEQSAIAIAGDQAVVR
jgi:hypothetical protein